MQSEFFFFSHPWPIYNIFSSLWSLLLLSLSLLLLQLNTSTTLTTHTCWSIKLDDIHSVDFK